MTTKSLPSDQRSKSCETACSSNSSCFFQKRKPINPLSVSLRSSLSKSTSNSVRQRVLSAKILKMKSIQNQLNDANFHLAEVMRENQALQMLQKRQDRALSKYEGAHAELPRLIKSHEEEIRVLTERNKMLRKNLKELDEQLKHKNEEVISLQEQLKHYEKLDKNKHLLEREKLLHEVQDYKIKLQKADEQIVTLNRKLTLETKSCKQKLNVEMTKYKQCQKELSKALMEVANLNKAMESKDKTQTGRKRFSNLLQRQTVSLVNLTSEKTDQSSIPDVKLEPIYNRKDNHSNKNHKGILKCPSENIRARLSSAQRDDEESMPSIDKASSASDSSTDKSRPNSSQKLDKIEMNLQNTIKKVEKNVDSDEIDKRLGDYCLQAIDSVKNYSHVINNHREDLKNAKADTDFLMESVKEAENMEKKLKRSTLLSAIDSTDMTDDNLDFVTQILTEELSFQKKYQSKNTNGTVEKKEPGINDKKKLLATLRAIDNGDNIDSFDSGTERKNKLMEELWGDVAED